MYFQSMVHNGVFALFLMLENRLSVSEPDEGSGSSECMDTYTSEETLISGVLIDIKDARSETSDIKSEADIPDDEISDSAEAMGCYKWCHWFVQ